MVDPIWVDPSSSMGDPTENIEDQLLAGGGSPVPMEIDGEGDEAPQSPDFTQREAARREETEQARNEAWHTACPACQSVGIMNRRTTGTNLTHIRIKCQCGMLLMKTRGSAPCASPNSILSLTAGPPDVLP